MPGKKITNIILALLIYLPSCAYFSLNIYIILMLFSVYLNYQYLLEFGKGLIKFQISDRNFGLLLLFSFFSLLLRLFDIPNWESFRDVYSFGYLFPLTYLVAKTIKGREVILDYLIWFVLVEAVVAFIEYLFGVSTFFTGLFGYRTFESYDLLYYTRTFGLSSNSSILALKFILGIILIAVRNYKGYKKIIFETVLILVSLISFGRIALICIVFYYLLKLIDEWLISKTRAKLNLIPPLVLILIFSVNPSWTTKQFTRNNTPVVEGRVALQTGGSSSPGNKSPEEIINITEEIGIDHLEMSGRNEIWNAFFNFWLDNVHFGNKGKKYLIGNYHAHNSFLEILSSYGIYLLVYLLLIFIMNLRWNNYVFIGSILFVAMGQYIILWGISIFDIIFYYILFFYSLKNEDRQSHSKH